MALTLSGYQIAKKSIDKLDHIKGTLTVKPYIPSVFVKPQFVQRYKVYSEDETNLYLPKQYGIETFGPLKTSTREVSQTDSKFWEFVGTIRDNQKEVVNSYLLPEPHDGVISLQTGGGKTVCALYIASQLKLPTIVLVHNTFLRDQWVERIKAFLPKARIGFVQGDIFDIENADIIVAMLQTVSQRDYTYKRIGLVIVDECHHIATESFSHTMTKLTSKYMLGLSATLERKDKLMHVIHWFLGPLLYKSNTADKVDENVNVEVFEYDPKDEKYNEVIYNNSGVMFTSLMINKVAEYEPRNKFLIELITDIYEEHERQLLVLSDRVDHTKALFDLLPTDIQEKACILGRNVKAETRAEWCSTKRILLATYAMVKEGFDLSTLNTLIMSTPRPDIEQIVGRILRIDKATRKIDPLIIDVVDPAFRRQFQVRLHLYKERNYKVTKMQI
jgi:superfamily II DNA or RNA helicase